MTRKVTVLAGNNKLIAYYLNNGALLMKTLLGASCNKSHGASCNTNELIL